MDVTEKEVCRKCGKVATWVYIPGYQGGGSPFSCDDCVSRGCSCNYRYVKEEEFEDDLPEGEEGIDYKWVECNPFNENQKYEKGVVWTSLDEKGREYPCCEYDYEKEGFNKN